MAPLPQDVGVDPPHRFTQTASRVGFRPSSVESTILFTVCQGTSLPLFIRLPNVRESVQVIHGLVQGGRVLTHSPHVVIHSSNQSRCCESCDITR